MGAIATNKRQITLYYNGNTSVGKQTHALALASVKQILPVDISKTKVTGTQWKELSSHLNKKVHELINRDHPDFVQLYGKDNLNMEEEDWLKILDKHPSVVVDPILIIGNEYFQISNPSDILNHLEPNSSNIPQPPTNKL